MSTWGVTGSRDTVRITRPGGIVVVTLGAEAGRAVYEGLKAIYGETADAKANLGRIRLPWWLRLLERFAWWRKRREVVASNVAHISTKAPGWRALP